MSTPSKLAQRFQWLFLMTMSIINLIESAADVVMVAYTTVAQL